VGGARGRGGEGRDAGRWGLGRGARGELIDKSRLSRADRTTDVGGERPHAQRRDPPAAEALRCRGDEPGGRDRREEIGERDRPARRRAGRSHARGDRLRRAAAQSPDRMTALVDASGVALRSLRSPRRIVSLIPSTTETLCALGLADALVGITAYCREPAALLRDKTRVGGEKDPD